METRMLIILLSSSVFINFACAEREFLYVDKSLDWTNAQTYCREKSADLVTVFDDNENEKLTALAEKRSDCIWIGLRRNIDRWQWSMGEPARYTDKNDPLWAIDQPNNSHGKQNCVALLSDNKPGLHDKECSETNYFICFDGNATMKNILVKESKTWMDAQEYCRTMHVDLASIHTDSEKQLLLVMMTDLFVTNAWIGLRRNPLTTWSDNSSTSFQNWEQDPDIYVSNGGCGCLWDNTGKWRALPCSHSKRFFCDKEKVDVRKQTVLKVKMESETDLNNKEIQCQILEQMMSRLASVGVANVTVKWRATRKINP